MEVSLWQQCLVRLENELPEQQFNTWIRPLHAVETPDSLQLLAPNQFVLDWVKKHHFETISRTLHAMGQNAATSIQLDIGSTNKPPATMLVTPGSPAPERAVPGLHKSNLNADFTFETFVGGKSNQLARAASIQVGENPGGA